MKRFLALSLAAVLISGCAISRKRKAPPAPPAPALRRLTDAEIPRFLDRMPKEPLVQAAQSSLKYYEANSKGVYRLADGQYTGAQMADSLRTFLQLLGGYSDPATLDKALRQNFDVFQSTGLDADGKIVFSAYYEPTFDAAYKKDDKHPYPIFRRPKDLIDVDLGSFNPKWKGERITGRLADNKLLPYFSREDIDTDGALADRGLECAWLDDAFDRLDLHIEGSGLLVFPDGKKMRANFDGTSGHPYKSVGRVLLDSGALSPGEATHEGIRSYFRNRPDAARWVIARNPRYTFFRLVPIEDSAGAIGTIQQPLVAGRAIAVDDKLFPLGTLAYITLQMPVTDAQGRLLGLSPESRFVLAQDTGGAIQGPGRVDFFMGSGDDARAIATRLWNEGRLYFLVKKLPSPRR